MGDNTGIEWCEATWNPVVGCSLVSLGCTNCYAMSQAARLLDGNPKTPHYAGTTQPSKGGPVWTGKVAIAPDHIMKQPLKWTRPRVIFVNSMGDLFHNRVPDSWIDQVFAIMALCPHHTFQVLTKRPERMLAYFDDPEHRAKEIGGALGDMLDGDWIWGDGKQYRQPIQAMISLAYGLSPDDQGFAMEDFLPLPNVWLGTSVEDQRRAVERLPFLVQVPAAVRFVSGEPLLGEVDLSRWLGEMPKIDWVIAGGESGKGARPMHPDWARSLRDQCAAAGVPFFFKQWGEWGPLMSKGAHGPLPYHVESGCVRFGKKAAGSLLDGREHKAMPELEV